MTKISVKVGKTVQESQYEPFHIELGMDIEVVEDETLKDIYKYYS
jgi:hypothetical protein